MRNIFFIVIGLFVFLSSCRSSRQVVQQTTHDSTTVSFRDVEKVVHIAGDSVKVSMQAAFKTPPSIPFDSLRGSGSGALREASGFVPQKQVVETNRTKVTIELTSSGEIKATAVTKDVDEKVTVPEKTIRTSTSSVTVVEKKESWLKLTWASLKKSVNTTLLILLVVAGISATFSLGFNPISIFKKLFNKS